MLGRVGGNARLSARGEKYAQALATKFNAMHIPDLHVLTSRFQRTIATARGVEAPQERVAALDELYAGDCEGLSYEEIQERYPQVIRDNKIPPTIPAVFKLNITASCSSFLKKNECRKTIVRVCEVSDFFYDVSK